MSKEKFIIWGISNKTDNLFQLLKRLNILHLFEGFCEDDVKIDSKLLHNKPVFQYNDLKMKNKLFLVIYEGDKYDEIVKKLEKDQHRLIPRHSLGQFISIQENDINGVLARNYELFLKQNFINDYLFILENQNEKLRFLQSKDYLKTLINGANYKLQTKK